MRFETLPKNARFLQVGEEIRTGDLQWDPQGKFWEEVTAVTGLTLTFYCRRDAEECRGGEHTQGTTTGNNRP